MSRQEENKILVEKSRDIASNPFVSRSALDAVTVRLICDISKSLAVIADKMTEEKDAKTESGKTKA